MKIKLLPANIVFLSISIVFFIVFMLTSNFLFVLFILITNILFFSMNVVINVSLQKYLNIEKDNLHKISGRNVDFPIAIKEVNDFYYLVKAFVSQEKLIEAVNITLSKNSDSQAFYKVVVENLGLIFNTHHLAFVIFDPIIRKYEVMYGNGFFMNMGELKDTLLLDNLVENSIFYRGEFSEILNVENNPDFNKLKNVGVLTLKSNLNYRGYILFGSEKEEFTTQFFEKYNFLILEINTSFSSHINNRRLKEKINELHLLNRIITLMEVNKDIDEVLYLFLTHLTAKEGLSFNRAILLKKENNILNGTYSIGPLTYEEADYKWNQLKSCPIDLFLEKSPGALIEPLEKLTKETSLQIIDDPLITEVIYSKRHKIVNFNHANFSTENKSILQKFNLKEFIISPLISYDNCLGIIITDNAFDNKYFSDERINSLVNVTAQTSLVINNLMLYNKIKNMAIKDDLTKLYNRRFFEEQLNLEIERATRHKTSLSLIMMDLDFFKNYNDRNGHIAGDALLSTISAIFKETCRASDYVCRYGGEEFVILLPETDIIGAYEVAEKIRKKIMANTFPYGEHQPTKRITISSGIATFPQLAADKMELKENSDKALYLSKKTGRNKVSVFSPDILNQI